MTTENTVPQTEPKPEPKPDLVQTIYGPNTMLMGATGTGKTYALRTLIEAGLEVFVIATEPGISSTLGDVPSSQLHWHYVAPASAGWDDLMDSSKKINTLTYESLAKMSNVNKQKYGQFLELLTTCNNFVCDRTGESFGDVCTWDHKRALVVDSLTGVNIMAMNLVVGSKPTKAMSDWMVAQDNLRRFLHKLVTDTRCAFILTAHLEREQDEITGAVKLMASTLGKKLAPEIPLFFDDVVMTKRDGSTFSWSTAATNVDLKGRNLPIQDKLEPSFVTIQNAWKKSNNIED